MAMQTPQVLSGWPWSRQFEQRKLDLHSAQEGRWQPLGEGEGSGEWWQGEGEGEGSGEWQGEGEGE